MDLNPVVQDIGYYQFMRKNTFLYFFTGSFQEGSFPLIDRGVHATYLMFPLKKRCFAVLTGIHRPAYTRKTLEFNRKTGLFQEQD